MNKGGRPRNSVWGHFIEPAVNNRVVCRGCETLISAKVDRLKAHFQRCPSFAKPAAEPVLSIPQDVPKPEPIAVPLKQPVPTKKVQSSLMVHFFSTSAAEKAKLDESVANFVLGCKLPFREDPEAFSQ